MGAHRQLSRNSRVPVRAVEDLDPSVDFKVTPSEPGGLQALQPLGIQGLVARPEQSL
ncbi:hypothetical protein GCM10009858_44900 [Terrabacter carboxydivorans]|uniref:Uncharacterized protein n=1 Tax=Terrabacter carboxydivorans TaxID=619730 RepID=A0ABP5ZNW8_9MICO